jgi:hypothetical protein
MTLPKLMASRPLLALPKLMASRPLLANESLRKERLFISFFLNDNRFEKTDRQYQAVCCKFVLF